MSENKFIDFPEGWDISKSVKPEKHNPKCSFRQTEGGVLCDCEVLYTHPRYVKCYEPVDFTWPVVGMWMDGKFLTINQILAAGEHRR